MTARLLIGSLLMAILFAGCEKGSSGATLPSGAPAVIENPVKEADLTRVKLTESAERRLGITVASIERRSIQTSRLYGGTLMPPQGTTLKIAAPLPGSVLIPDDRLPLPGSKVHRGQVLLKLSPVLAGEHEVLAPSDRISLAKVQADLAAGRAEMEGQLHAAEADVQAARAQLDRADRLRRESAGSEQAYEAALAAVRKAEAQQEAARSRLEVLRSIRVEAQPESAPALEIVSPLEGLVSALHVRGGIRVTSGTPLVEVMSTDPIWVRVPIYAGDLSAINTVNGVRIRTLGAPSGESEVPVKSVRGVPAGNPLAASVDLFFELPNPEMKWKPDERVMVLVPCIRPVESVVVPWSAVVHDIHGASWVYVRTSPQTYARQRVEVREVLDGLAVLSRRPAADLPVVITGTPELFGTEFGVGK